MTLGPQLNFWCATTDNDRGGGNNNSAKIWRDAGLHWLQHRIDGVSIESLDEGHLRITADGQNPRRRCIICDRLSANMFTRWMAMAS